MSELSADVEQWFWDNCQGYRLFSQTCARLENWPPKNGCYAPGTRLYLCTKDRDGNLVELPK